MKDHAFALNFRKSARRAVFVSKVTFLMVLHVLGLSLLGFFISVVLYLFSDNALVYLTDSWYSSFGERLLGYLFIGFFFFLFPLLYVWVAWSWSIAYTVHFIFSKIIEQFVSYFVGKFIEFVFAHQAIKEKVEHGLMRSLLFETLPNYLEKLPNVRGLLRPVTRLIIKKINLQELFTLAIQKNENQIDKERISQKLSEEIMNKASFLIKKPSLAFFFWILGAHLTLALAIQLMVL